MFKKFFKKEKKVDNETYILVAALLVHAARIDESYTEIEKKIITKSIILLNKFSSEEAETILSLTNDDEDNIMVSVLAEKNNPNKRTIALVNKQNYSLLQSSLKINDLVDPRNTTISTILKHVHKGTIETVYTLLDGEYEFIEAEVLETSELISKSIKDSNLPKEIRIGAVVRKKEVIIPKSDFKFEKKDLVVFLTKREHLEKVESLFRISSLI